jgi:excisionase family DNA binding protein
MPDLLLRDTDRDELIRETAAAVVAALRPILTDDMHRPRSRDDMAEWLGIGVATLDRLTRAGEIPSVMLGSRRCYIPAHVVAARATANAIAPPDH